MPSTKSDSSSDRVVMTDSLDVVGPAAAAGAPDRLKVEPRSTGAPPQAAAPGGGGGGQGPDETDSGAGSDEVKVFNDEDEREAAPSAGDNLQQVDILSDIKSRLITETAEQAKADVRRDYGAFIAMPFAAMSASLSYQHLMSSMPYAGMSFPSGNPLARPPLFYGDHLSSPPPAHMAGLRPPMYLPPSAAPGQSPYPYSMEQQAALAAWQHQAAMYHQSGAAALRAASPYGGLPAGPAIAAAAAANGLASPMSRFSPTGLLGHPGLSPAQAAAVASAAGHHLPQSVKKEPKKEHASPKKSKEPHIKKPLNAFMLYMKEMRPVVQSECTLKESAAINQILGRRWHGLSREEQAKYYEKSRMERQKHLQMYPHWNARDNYRFGVKKKKRKRDRSDDPAAASMKKCRARYGLDQQDLWCRPCRRKKKCIRVQAYLDQKMAAGGDGKSSAGSGSATSSGNPTNNNDLSKVKRDPAGHSDGEDDDLDLDDDVDDDDSPRESRNGRESLESPSEQSLTSPAGFASLPSIGSPTASLASPQTPSNGDNPFGGPAANSDWFRGGSGAFRPPAVAANTSSGGVCPPNGPPPPPQSFNQFGHHLQYAYNGLIAQHHLNMQQNGRDPVGADPRDAKNPLSISQLTTSSRKEGGQGGSLPPPPPPTSLGAPQPGHLGAMGPAGGLFGGNCFPAGVAGVHPPPGVGGPEKRPLVGMT